MGDCGREGCVCETWKAGGGGCASRVRAHAGIPSISKHGGMCDSRERVTGWNSAGVRVRGREVALAWHVAWGQRQVRVGVSVCLFELFVKGDKIESKNWTTRITNHTSRHAVTCVGSTVHRLRLVYTSWLMLAPIHRARVKRLFGKHRQTRRARALQIHPSRACRRARSHSAVAARAGAVR